MVPPGFSVSDIASAIDNTIALCIKLKEAPKEIERILSSINHATSLLKRWERLLRKHGDKISPDDLEFLEEAVLQYKLVLAKLNKFKDKHGRLVDREMAGRFYWVITEHFRQDRSSLEDELRTMEDRMKTALHMSSLEEIYNSLGRSNSLACIRDDGPPSESLHQASSILSTPKLCEHPGYSIAQPNSSFVPSPRTLSGDTVYAEPEPYMNSASASPPPKMLNKQEDTMSFAACSDGGTKSLRSEVSSESTSRQPSVFSTTLSSKRSSVTQYSDADSQAPVVSPYALQPSSATSRSSISYEPNSGASRSQVWKEDIFRTQVRREPVSQARLDGSHDSYKASSLRSLTRSNTLPVSAPLVSRSITNLIKHGEIRIWYTRGPEHPDNYVVKDIDIVRYGRSKPSEIYIKAANGMNLRHRCPSNTAGLAQGIFRMNVPRSILSDQPQVKSLLKFDGNNFLDCRLKDRSYKLFFEGTLEYTFTDDRDNLCLQSYVADRTLISEDHIESITCSNSKIAHSKNHYIQLWRSLSGLSIRYLYSTDGKYEYREHNIRNLKRFFSKDEVKKRGKWDREVNFEVVDGTKSGESSPIILKILFSAAAAKNGWVNKVNEVTEKGSMTTDAYVGSWVYEGC